MDDAPDWLNEAAADVGVQPVQPTAGGAGAGAAGALAASSALSAAADMAASLPRRRSSRWWCPPRRVPPRGGYPPAGEAGGAAGAHDARGGGGAHGSLGAALYAPHTVDHRAAAARVPHGRLFRAGLPGSARSLRRSQRGRGGATLRAAVGGGGYMGAGKPLLPPPADTNMTWPSSYTAVGRLLGFAAVHGLRVPLPLHASAFFHLTRTPLVAGAPSDDPPRSDGTAAGAAGAAAATAAAAAGAAAAGAGVGWGAGAGGLGGSSQPRPGPAWRLRRAVGLCHPLRRLQATGAPRPRRARPSAAAPAAGPASPLPKYARAIGDVQQRLLLSRTPALDAMRNGLVGDRRCGGARGAGAKRALRAAAWVGSAEATAPAARGVWWRRLPL